MYIRADGRILVGHKKKIFKKGKENRMPQIITVIKAGKNIFKSTKMED